MLWKSHLCSLIGHFDLLFTLCNGLSGTNCFNLITFVEMFGYRTHATSEVQQCNLSLQEQTSEAIRLTHAYLHLFHLFALCML